MKKLRNFVLGACVGLTALSLASCKKEETGTFDLTVWGPTEQTAILKKLVGDFKTANETENLKFNIEVGVVSEADAYAQLQKDVTTGADVFAFPNDQLANLIRIGALSKLGDRYRDRMVVFQANLPIPWE